MKQAQLSELCRMKQATVKKYVKKQLKSLGYNPVVEDGYVYAKGTYPVLLCSHMDTVHEQVCQFIKYTGNNGVIMTSPQGIGGDDRCGIFLILNILKEINCSVVFLEDEEIGCVGARKFAEAYKGNDLGNNYIVEFDRRGRNDCVFYSLDNQEFVDFCESTGYFKSNWGSCSDISYIAPALNIAAVNLSSGYYAEHTKGESINYDDVCTIFEEAKKLILKDVDKPFEWKEKEYKGYYGYYDYDDYFYYPSYYKKKNSSYSCEKQMYYVYVQSENGGFKTYEVSAHSEKEALGTLFMLFRDLTYNEVCGVCLADD